MKNINVFFSHKKVFFLFKYMGKIIFSFGFFNEKLISMNVSFVQRVFPNRSNVVEQMLILRKLIDWPSIKRQTIEERSTISPPKVYTRAELWAFHNSLSSSRSILLWVIMDLLLVRLRTDLMEGGGCGGGGGLCTVVFEIR